MMGAAGVAVVVAAPQQGRRRWQLGRKGQRQGRQRRRLGRVWVWRLVGLRWEAAVWRLVGLRWEAAVWRLVGLRWEVAVWRLVGLRWEARRPQLAQVEPHGCGVQLPAREAPPLMLRRRRRCCVALLLSPLLASQLQLAQAAAAQTVALVPVARHADPLHVWAQPNMTLQLLQLLWRQGLVLYEG